MSRPNFNNVVSFNESTKRFMIPSLIAMLVFTIGTYLYVNTTLGLVLFIVLTVVWYASILHLEQRIVVSNGEIPSFEWLDDDDKLYNALTLPGCPDPAMVFNYQGLLGILENDDFQDYLIDHIHNGHLTVLPILYGEVDGGLCFGDLTQAPSLLVAGISGSGKSTLLHQMLAVLLTYNKPNNLELYMCDTKRVELSRYAKFPHTKKIIYDHEEVDAFLTEILDEINERYRYLERVNITSIAEYNKLKLGEKMRMPFIVVVIEELADIMLGADKNIPIKLIKILQKGRAAGVHVITLTQRPSAQIINSSIKANIPNRVALRVSSATDSRIILEQNGAELLTTKGEMIVLDGGKVTYALSTLVTGDEIKKLEQAWLAK